MSEDPSPTPRLVEIRKYPNRRYYDTTRSRHLTLEAIRALICSGTDVRITDSKTSEDISVKVFTQIILELDTPKLELFPAALLTQLIRVNSHWVKGFFETFFNQTLASFLEYQQQVEAQSQQTPAWPLFLPPVNAWARAVFNPPSATAHLAVAPGTNPAASAPVKADLAQQVKDLQQQVSELHARLEPPRRRRRKAN